MLKKTLLGFALALAALGAAQAQTKPVHFIAGIGITGGGEKLATVRYTDGSTQDVRSGGLVHFYGGLEFNVAPDVLLQATVGYHVDSTTARNGDIEFERFPIEVLGQYALDRHLRLGGGLRFVPSAKLSSSGAASIGTADFDSHVGLVVEGEYLFTPVFGTKLRFVSEKYKPSNGAPSINGDHVGLYASFHF